MISMVMRRVVQILMGAVMGIVTDILTSPVVAKETAALPLDLTDGRTWVDRESPIPSLSPLETRVQVQARMVSILIAYFPTSLVVISLVASVVGANLNLNLVLLGLLRL